MKIRLFFTISHQTVYLSLCDFIVKVEEFKIIQPNALLKPYVKHYWLLKTFGQQAIARTLPTGMMNLIFHRGSRLLSVRDKEYHPRAFLSGHEKMFADLEYSGQVDMISVVFYATGARAFFNIPMDRLNDLKVSANDIEDKELAELENSLINTENDQLCILLIERFLLKRLTRLAEYNQKRIEAAISLINSGKTDVSSLADAACLSSKHFNRIFSEYIGTNPKEFIRTIRFQRALYASVPSTNKPYRSGIRMWLLRPVTSYKRI